MSEWQPIETAPKDGTRILIRADSTFVANYGFQKSSNENGWLLVNDCWIPCHMATHWMPLPKAPE